MTPAPPPSVAVIGGGLAGITAAIALAEAGAAVTLLEARPRLGGATCSFSRDGLTVDTGQHIFLGCCTAYRGLLGKLGMTEHAPVQDRFDVSVLAPGPAPRRGRLRRTALPGPLHMLPALGRYPFLSLSERASVARPALAMRFVDPARPGVDEQRFGDWLAARGQRDRARRALWDLFTVSALNIAGDDASLSLAAFVVKTGLLGKNNAADIGVPALPLGELHGDAGATLLTKLGAQVLLSAKVAAIEPATPPASAAPSTPAPPLRPGSPAFRVRLARPADTIDPADDPDPDPDSAAADAAEILADAVVLAVPHEVAARLIPPGALPDATVAGWAGLGASPIVNVHVIYDRPVMDEPFVAAIDSPVQWVFDRTSISGLDRTRPPASTAAPPLTGRSTWPFRCQRRMSTWTYPQPRCASSSSLPWPSCSRPRVRRRSPSFSSPASDARRSVRGPVPPASARRRPRTCRAWSWPARGPRPDGPTPWRAPSAAA